MFETSKDIFWLALSIVILLIGVSMVWGMFYITLMLRDAKKITKSLRRKMDLFDQILKIVKDKTEQTANYIPPLIDGVGKLINHFKDKNSSGKKSTKKSTKK